MKRIARFLIAFALAVPVLAQTGSPPSIGPVNPFTGNGPFAPASSIFWIQPVTTYGAVCGDTGDSSTAINAAIAAAPTGGFVVIPCDLRILSPVNLNSKIGVRLIGLQAQNSGAGLKSRIHYDNGNTDARAIDARTSTGIEIGNLAILSNSSFTGTLIDASGTSVLNSSFFYLHDSIIGSTSETASSLVNIEWSVRPNIERVDFIGGVNQVVARAALSGNVQSATIQKNQFTTYRTSAISDPAGSGWLIAENNFEPGRTPLTGTLAVTNGNAAVVGSSTLFTTEFGSSRDRTKWFGDGGTDNVAILSRHRGRTSSSMTTVGAAAVSRRR
jgi:hypothetical protein